MGEIAVADAILARARAVIGNDTDGQIEPTPDGFRVIECGRLFFARALTHIVPRAGLAFSRWVMDRPRLIAECILSEFPLPDSALGR